MKSVLLKDGHGFKTSDGMVYRVTESGALVAVNKFRGSKKQRRKVRAALKARQGRPK